MSNKERTQKHIYILVASSRMDVEAGEAGECHSRPVNSCKSCDWGGQCATFRKKTFLHTDIFQSCMTMTSDDLLRQKAGKIIIYHCSLQPPAAPNKNVDTTTVWFSL
jgi:hypothetical protein